MNESSNVANIILIFFSPVCYIWQESLLFERSFSSVPNQLPRNPEMIFHDRSHFLSIFQTEVFLNIEIAEILLWSTNVSSATAHSSIFLKQLFKSLKMGIRHALEKMNTSAVGAGRRDFFQLKFIFSKYFSVGFLTFFFLRYGMCACLFLSLYVGWRFLGLHSFTLAQECIDSSSNEP